MARSIPVLMRRRDRLAAHETPTEETAVAVRTFYWKPGKKGFFQKKSASSFRIGNAGDLLNRDLVHHLYGDEPLNVKDEGKRLLLVGSVAHRALTGDILAGVGTKGSPLPDPGGLDVEIRGVRGPITYDALAAAGFDVSGVRFQYDPGLLVNELYPAESATPAEPGRVAFIPHYRDRLDYKRSKSYATVDIDCEPATLAREIARAEYVLTSSLHGLVFAHALGRPVTLIAPIRAEPILKYQDYVASVGLPWVDPVDLDTALAAPKPTSPADIDFDASAFDFPTIEELRARGIA